jgi:hypothetical protein
LKEKYKTKSKAINANREITNPHFQKIMLTIEVDIMKSDYETFCDIAKQFKYPPPPELLIANHIMEYAKKIRNNEVTFEFDNIDD